MGIDILSLKKVYKIGPTMVPADDPICVEIAYFDQSEAEGTSGTYIKNELFLKGWKLPLGLNNKAIDALVTALGTRDTDEMQGRKIMLQTQMDTIYGESKLVVKILPVKPRPNMPMVTQNQMVAALSAVDPSPPAKALPPKSKDIRQIGEDNALKVQAKLKLNKTTFDKALNWIKINDRESHDAMVGKEVSEIPAWTLPAIGYYLESLKTDPALISAPPKQSDPESDAPPPAFEIDVPF